MGILVEVSTTYNFHFSTLSGNDKIEFIIID